MNARVLERAGVSLHYWHLSADTGRPLLVLTHGATADHAMFDQQVAALAGKYPLLTWDVRGHGLSRPLKDDFVLQDCADDLLALLDALGVEQAVLAGQSMGGLISQYVYLRARQRVKALVIIDAVNIAFAYKKWEVWALKASLPLFDLWPYEHFKRTVARSVAITPAAQEYMLRTIGQLSRAEFLKIWKAVTMAVDDKGFPGHHIRVPFLLTHGDHDNAGTIRRDAPRWAAYEPDVTYTVIPDAGHNANQDNAPFFNRVLLEFLDKRVA
ncbi:MAG: alpha/beta fold hydrolase [Chloroflexi bacterium]|nr:alpha/beta fold hydrolase [Chloroflexota bacterium]